jgi:hypothetical protein
MLCRVFPLLVFKLEELKGRIKNYYNSVVENKQVKYNLFLVGSKLLNAIRNAVFKVTVVYFKLKVIFYRKKLYIEVL